MELAIGTWVVILRTDEGHDVIYQEFAGGRADISVSQGQHVDAGDEIGYLDNGAFSGATENNNGLVTHLHLGICTGTWANAVANGGSFTESTWVNPRNIL
ncbi:peptidoglycan DD-metalloendopeptidase family protein [Agrilactobacillus composti]|nr:peptidoglycan DD-metalloendopeptidase family protein [Agrilactobacillus composti]